MQEFKTYKIGPKKWCVGENGINIDTLQPDRFIFDDELDADEMRDYLNAIFRAGQSSVRDPLRALLGL